MRKIYDATVTANRAIVKRSRVRGELLRTQSVFDGLDTQELPASFLAKVRRDDSAIGRKYRSLAASN